MLSGLWTILLIASEVATVVVILLVLRRPREPRTMLAWILILLLLPGLGLTLFLLLDEPRKRWIRRRLRRRRRRLLRLISGKHHALPENAMRLPQLRGSQRRLISLAQRLGGYPALDGHEVTIYHDADKTFLAIQLAIESAQSTIHMEYYIFQPDETGHAIADLLIAKARTGVKCRLLLDYIGSWRLGRLVRYLRANGVQVAFSQSLLPWRGKWQIGFRNHRKIVVIDGTIAFTGSQNIGNEYSGSRMAHGPWRDTHLKVVGPAVQQLQEVFMQDWHLATGEDLLDEVSFPAVESAGNQIVQIVPTGPEYYDRVMHQLLFAAINSAHESVSVITPYFVPDTAMVLAFQSACYRGLTVRLIIPARTDQLVALWAARSYYEELLGAGVEVYEHDIRMLHSKVLIVDETWAMVGSANMDERSFRINYELTTLLHSQELARELMDDFEEICHHSKAVTLADVRRRGLGESLLLGLARLASPLL